MSWQDDKRWSDKFLPEIKEAIGASLIGEPPLEEDQERNTDLIVLRMAAVRIACRVRRFKYESSYGGEFTIRSGRPSGTKTELTKLVEGWGDYLFYGFSNKSETGLSSWRIADLKVFRLWFNRQIVKNRGALPGQSMPNSDGSSQFMAFRWAEVADGFVVSEKRPAMAVPAAPGTARTLFSTTGSNPNG